MRAQEAKNCRTFQIWDKQMSVKFGFIPLQDQILPSTDNRNVHITEAVVHSSGAFNFF